MRCDVSFKVADLIGQKTEYVKNKGLNDETCKNLIINALKEMRFATKSELRKVIDAALPAILDEKQKDKKLSNLLQSLRREEIIDNDGRHKFAKWFLK